MKKDKVKIVLRVVAALQIVGVLSVIAVIIWLLCNIGRLFRMM